MTIKIFQGNTSVGKGDVNIIIDVIRAFTTSHIAFKKGIKKSILVNEVDKAILLKKYNPDYLLVGEVNALPIPGFDYGNSPYAIENSPVNLKGKTLVHKTTNGVRAVLNNLNAEHVLVTGFQSADAVIQYVQSIDNIQHINIIASHPTGDEDLACAEYLKAKMENHSTDIPSFLERVKNCEAAQKFYHQAEFNEKDIELAAKIDYAADFVMKAKLDQSLPYIERTALKNKNDE